MEGKRLDASLTPDDYRKIVRVLEDVIDAQSLADLADRLPGVLARHLGWPNAFDATTLAISPAGRGEGADRNAEAIAETLGRLLARFVRSLSCAQAVDDPSFTPREREVAQLVSDGLTNRQIAARLGIRPDTVKKHLTNALTKADCTNRTQLAVIWRAWAADFGPAIGGPSANLRQDTAESAGSCRRNGAGLRRGGP